MRKKTIIIVSAILLFCCFVIALNLISDSKKSGIELTDLLEIQVGETEVTFLDDEWMLFQLTDEGVERLDELIKNTKITHKRENDLTLAISLFQERENFGYFYSMLNRDTEYYITDFKFKNKNTLQIYTRNEVFKIKTEDHEFYNKFIEIIEEHSYEKSDMKYMKDIFG